MPRSRWHGFAILFCLLPPAANRARSWQAEASVEKRLAGIQQQILRGDLASAMVELERAQSHSPRDPRLFNFRGVIEAQQNRFTAAESSFQKAIALAPRFADPYLNLGRLYQEHAARPAALENATAVYEALLKHDPNHVEANFQAASLFNRRGVYAASLKHLSRLPAESQGRAAALALRCANSFALRHTAQADICVTRLLASHDLSESDVVQILPVLLNGQGDLLAARLLGGLAARQLASAETLRKLAAIHDRHGRVKEARGALEKTLDLERPSAALLSRIAQLAYRSGDLDGALGYLARARDLEPKNAAIHFFFGMTCVELKLPPEAKASLQEAVRLEPDNPHFNYALGAVLVGQKNADEAIKHFQKYRNARPDDPRGAFALGVAYFEALEIEAARAELLAAADEPETRMGAQLYLGRLALTAGRAEEALVHFKQAVEANPAGPEAYADAALVRIRREEYGLAEKDLSSALALSPDHYLTNLRLLMLYQRTKDHRAEAQAKRVEALQKAGEEKERLLLRSLEIRPY
jgi:tetratricopeptide (TPR) repeat protein